MPRDLRGFIPSLGITVVRLYIHFLQFIYYYMMLTHLMNIFFNFSRNIGRSYNGIVNFMA